MANTLEHTIKRLWLTYKLYHTVAVKNGSDSKHYATSCTNNFLQYLLDTTTGDMAYNWDIPQAIENQIRILGGMIECYDRPVVKDKITTKTRWSL
jgi:hypothetical protein